MTFRTQARRKGKLCNLIIDRGSAMHCAMQEVIDKLLLPTDKILNPYKVAWANDFIIPLTH